MKILKKIVSIKIFIVLVIMFMFSIGIIAYSESKPIIFAMVPYESVEKLKTKYDPLMNFLSEEIGQKIELFVCSDYSVVVEALRSGQADMADFGALPYLIAKREASIIGLFCPVVSGESFYRSIIISRKDSGIKKISDLSGKSFAFSDPLSTSGYLFPLEMLEENGIIYGENFLEPVFAGSHEAVVTSVLNGHVMAGGTFAEAINIYIKDKEEREKINILGYSKKIPYGVVVVRSDMSKLLVDKIKEAYLKLNKDPENEFFKNFSTSSNVTEYVPFNEEDFNSVVELAEKIGINLEKQD
jgi:phosphonate transport system substrate-binding protein